MTEVTAGLTEKVRHLVDQYRSTQQQGFTVHGPFGLHDVWKGEAVKKPGCYIIYGSDGSALYVGMSQSEVGGRIGNHLSDRVQQSQFWQQFKKEGRPPSYFVIVAVVDPTEAPSLEDYLKLHLTPQAV